MYSENKSVEKRCCAGALCGMGALIFIFLSAHTTSKIKNFFFLSTLLLLTGLLLLAGSTQNYGGFYVFREACLKVVQFFKSLARTAF